MNTPRLEFGERDRGMFAGMVMHPEDGYLHAKEVPCDRCGDLSMNTVPNKPKTPIRGIRVSDDDWRELQRVAAARGDTPSDVVRAAIRRYNKRHGGAK